MLVGAVAFAACADDQRPGATATRAQSDIDFSPGVVQVGDDLDISGEGFHEESIQLVLITQEQRSRLSAALREGELYVLATVEPRGGSFSTRVEVAGQIVSQNGRTAFTVTPGRYSVGAIERDGLTATGPLTIEAR